MCDDLRGLHMRVCSYDTLAKLVPPDADLHRRPETFRPCAKTPEPSC